MQGEQSIKGEIWISKKRGMGIFWTWLFN
jgi:hypothetical protein